MAAHEPFNYELFRQQAVQQLRTGKPNLAGIQGLLAPVIRDLLETALLPDGFSNDISNHVVQDRPEEKSRLAFSQSADNSRPNQYQRKLKHVVNVDKKLLDREILELYENGNSYETIQDTLYTWHKVSYDVDTLINITNQFFPRVQAWQRRPLQPVYVCLWITEKICHLWQETELINKTVYSVVGIDLQGNRDVLGYYIDNRSSVDFWPHLLDDLKLRGVRDILIICTDSVPELKEIIKSDYPLTHVHGSITHIMRNSLQHIKGKDLPNLRRDLQSVYQAPTRADALRMWQTVKTNWEARYPLIVTNWEQSWPDIISIMQYPNLIRSLTHGTSLITTCQELLLNSVKVNGVNTTEVELIKSLCATSWYVLSKHKLGINKWGLLMQQLAVVFGERIQVTN